MKEKILQELPQSTKNELFSILLDLVTKFQEFCDVNGLKCFAIGGTLIGAIRHSGFIPWDDDIDLAMMRDDYNKLLELTEKADVLGAPYRFLTMKTDTGFSKCIVRLTNTDTTAIPIKDIKNNYNHGCFIDIFPIDGVPDTAFRKRLYQYTLNCYKGLRNISARYYGDSGDKFFSKPKKIMYNIISCMFNVGLITNMKLSVRTNKSASRYSHMQTKQVGLGTFAVKDRYQWDREDFDSFTEHEFENIKILIPCGYHNILTKQYGDYMTPVHAQSVHGDTIINTSIPYIIYIEKYQKELNALWELYEERK